VDALIHRFLKFSKSEKVPKHEYESQSETIRSTPVEGDGQLKTQIVSFADDDAGWAVDIGSSVDSTMNLADNTSSDSLGNFLGRPVTVTAINWVVGAPFLHEFNPWDLFCSDPFVKDKLSNFELLRCNLCVKLTINGTPFHYGRLLASYNPLSGYDQVTVVRNFIDQDLIGASQRPHVFLNPTKSEGGMLHLPYFFRENYMSLTLKDYKDMGKITIKSFGVLNHANGGNTPVTIRAFVWAEDVVLTMPTTLVSQSGKTKKLGSDEYGQGIISKPASAIAKAAGVLSGSPIIGPYMRATQMVATGVGDFAKLFGYSRPPLLQNETVVKPQYVGNTANVDAPENIHKLTLDSKAEVTIDPRVTGLSAEDEMNLLSLVQKESYLTTFNFSSTHALNDLLWQCRVNPSLHGTFQNEIHPTAMAFFMNYFNSWQGSIKFRFQIVKSNYHQGRIIVRYDPNSFGSAVVNYNVNYSRVVDISEEDDFEIVVGWGQKEPFLSVPSMNASNNWFSNSLPRLPIDSNREHNGVLEVNVVNELVSPLQNQSISVNVYVSMCEDAKFADPVQQRLNAYHLWPEAEPLMGQSGMELKESGEGYCDDKPGESEKTTTLTKSMPEADQMMNVFYGEIPTTLRELCKRYVLTRSYLCPISNWYNTWQQHTLLNKDLPYQTGFDPLGLDVSTLAGNVTLGYKSPLAYFMPAYAGYRGAIRHKYVCLGTTVGAVTRRHFAGSGNGSVTTTVRHANTNEIAFLGSPNTAAGTTLQYIPGNNTIQAELPFYSQGRIGYSRLVRAQDLNCNSHEVLLVGSHQSDSINPVIQDYVAAGEDFSLYFYTGAPILYRYTLTPNS